MGWYNSDFQNQLSKIKRNFEQKNGPKWRCVLVVAGRAEFIPYSIFSKEGLLKVKKATDVF